MRKSGTVEKIARHKLNDEINWVCVYGVNSHNGSSWIDGENNMNITMYTMKKYTFFKSLE